MSSGSQAEIALQAEIQRLRTRIAELERERQVPSEIVEKSPVMISIVRAPDFVYELVNPAFQALAPGKEFVGRRFADVWVEVSEPLVEILSRVIETGQPFKLEDAPYTIQRGPGAPPEVVYVTYSWIPLPGPDGKPDRILTLAHETTGSVRQQRRLRDTTLELSERVGELQTVLDAAPVAIWIAHDPQCQEITGNPMADQFYESGAGENVSANVTPARRFFQGGKELEPQELPMQESAARGVDIRNSELEVFLPSGRPMHMLGNASPLRNAAGEVRGCVGAFLDITARKRAEEALKESEAVLRAFFDSPGLLRGIVELIDGQIVHVSCNEAAAQMFGLGRESIAGKTASQAGASEDVARAWVPLYEQSRRTGQPVSGEYARRDAAGKERWMLATASYLGTGLAGNPRFAYTILDLTERKRAEEALRESETRLRMLSDNLPEGAIYRYRIDADGKPHIDFISAGIEPLTGVPAAEYMADAAAVERGIAPEDRDRLRAAIAQSRERLTRFDIEVRHVHRTTGEIRWSLMRSTPILRPDGSTVWDGIELDITARKQAEAALRESEERFRSVAENMSEGLMVFDAQGNFMYQNAASLRIHGFGTPERGRVERENLPATWKGWDETGRLMSFEEWPISRVLRGERFQDQILRATCVETGQEFYASYNGCPMADASGRLIFGFITVREITARLKTEQALRESESRERARAAELEALMEMTPAAIFVSHDSECRHMSGNRRAYDLLRWGRGKNISKSAPDGPTSFRAVKDGIEIPPTELPLQKAAATGQLVRDYAFDVIFEDGVTLNLLCDATPLLDEKERPRGGVGVLSDVTELKRAEQRLRESQKLESLGLLAGGVAHDFNNLLVGVVGNASLAQDLLPPDHPVAELVSGVLRAGEQAAHLTRQMLAYSGKGRFVVEELDLSALIPELIGLVRPSIPKKIAIHLDMGEDLPAVEADRGQIQQVFMNLALNAGDAIGSHEGAITIRTGVEQVNERYTRLHPETADLPPGKHAFLEVRDTGCGMDEATKAKIFDPFFSTKFIGRGLGLAAVAGIVRGHKGAIAVTSAPGQGSCFTVLFPAAARGAEATRAAASDIALTGVGTVLVVDDEPMVREMAKRALERQGYTVLTADGGIEAIDVFRRHPGPIAAIVLDLSMPRMNGEEALPELRKIRPEVAVIVSSGYSESEAMVLFQGQRVSGFIQKPYTSKAIAEKMKVCLG